MDLWFRKCDDHYEYLATYVDDILVFSQDPMPIIEAIKKDYILKGVGVPEYYLGGDVIEASEVMKRIGVQTHISARTYVANSLDCLGKMLGQGPFQKADWDFNNHGLEIHCNLLRPPVENVPS